MSAKSSTPKSGKPTTKKAAPRKAAKPPARRRPSALSFVLVAGFIATGVIVGLLLEGLYRKRPAIDDSASAGDKRPGNRARTPRLPASGAGPATPADRDDSGWHAIPEPIVAPAPGEVPTVNGDPSAAPPEPVAGPDPSTYRPPTSNPGGVNGDRPPRPIRGVD